MILNDLIPITIISIVFLLIFALAEIFHYGLGWETEKTRKFAHFSGGIVALSFSYVLSSHWSVLFLCIAFVAIILISKKKNLLKSIHCVDRESEGGVYHPIAVYLTFLTASMLKQPIFYIISILVLSVSDALAALVGKKYGFKLYQVQEDNKSLEGSFIFFSTTFLVIHLCLLLFTQVGRLESVLTALLIAIVVTVFEAVSLKGSDNIFVPLVTLFILSKNISPKIEDLWFQLIILGITFIAFYIMSLPSKKLSLSGVFILAIVGYGAWGLIGYTWFLPIFLGAVLIFFTDWVIPSRKDFDEIHRVIPVFYILAVPAVWILITNFAVLFTVINMEHLLFSAYIAGIVSQLSIIRGRRRLLTYGFPTKISCSLSKGAVFTVFFIPVYYLIFRDGSPFFSILTCFVGSFIADRLYWSVKVEEVKPDEQLKRGVVVTMVLSILVFLVNYIYYGV